MPAKSPPRQATVIAGVGPDAEVVTNAQGGRQSASLRPVLLPARALLHVSGEVLAPGERKYDRDNWRKIPSEDHLDHALTHILAHMAGDRQDDHLGHAACRMLMCLEIYLAEQDDAK